jgi:hypothetical protein
MDELFEARFQPIENVAGRNFSRCGKCTRYMKLIPCRCVLFHWIKYCVVTPVPVLCTLVFTCAYRLVLVCQPSPAAAAHVRSSVCVDQFVCTARIATKPTIFLRVAVSNSTRSSPARWTTLSWCSSRREKAILSVRTATTLLLSKMCPPAWRATAACIQPVCTR